MSSYEAGVFARLRRKTVMASWRSLGVETFEPSEMLRQPVDKNRPQQPSPWGTLSPALELQAKRELQIALALSGGAAAFVEYLAEGRGIGRVEADIGRPAATAVAAPIRVVPDVVGFGAELETKPFVDRDGLE